MTRHQTISTTLGRIVRPDGLPSSTALFWTTADFDGRLDAQSVEGILATAREQGAEVGRLETCTQVHGTTAVEVTRVSSGWAECADCDALWTRQRGVALGIKIADCLPLTLIDTAEGGPVINLHAGWRGAAAGIVARTIESASESGPLSPDTRAYIGPSIRQCCFEVGEEVVDAFRDTHDDVETFVDRSRTKPHLDLAGLVRQSLGKMGIADERIWDGGLCTRCPDSIFHSYRRSGPRAGRNLAVVCR